MKKSWSLHANKHILHAPFLVDFNDWPEDKGEVHKRMRSSRKTEDNSSQAKTAVKVCSVNPKTKTETNPQTQRAKFCAESKLCFLAFKEITCSGNSLSPKHDSNLNPNVRQHTMCYCLELSACFQLVLQKKTHLAVHTM